MSADILIVDGEKATRTSLQDLLELEGYKADAAASGEDALEKLNEGEYDLMLLELKLPGIDGLEVMSQAHLLYPQTKVIVLTGHGSLETSIEAIRLGVQDYILKPFEAESLLASVARCFTAKVERQREEMLIQQLEASLEQLKEIEGIITPDIATRLIIALPEGIKVDLERREISRGNTRSRLTPNEGNLMSIFLENRGRVMSYHELIFLTKGVEISGQKAAKLIRPMISRLRNKLSVFPGMEEWVRNIRGTGYMFDPVG